MFRVCMERVLNVIRRRGVSLASGQAKESFEKSLEQCNSLRASAGRVFSSKQVEATAGRSFAALGFGTAQSFVCRLESVRLELANLQVAIADVVVVVLKEEVPRFDQSKSLMCYNGQ